MTERIRQPVSCFTLAGACSAATQYLASAYNPAMQDISNQLTPGVRVKVTQQIAARDRTIATEVTGTVVTFEQQTTGSWFAHSIENHLWLDRLVLQKDDGEISSLVLDQYTRIDLV